MAKCGKCEENTNVQIAIGGMQTPLCISCQDNWERAKIKAFEVFIGRVLPQPERSERPARRRIDWWEGKLK